MRSTFLAAVGGMSVLIGALAGCGGTAPEEQVTASALQASDFPALASAECVDVAQFYFEALSGRDFAQAALVWDDPAVDAARLEAVFGRYAEPEITWGDPFTGDGPEGQFCSISGVLTDASDPQNPAREGTFLLTRIGVEQDVEGISGRWVAQSSTFIEPIERSTGD